MKIVIQHIPRTKRYDLFVNGWVRRNVSVEYVFKFLRNKYRRVKGRRKK